jgi:hypothetical protein
MTEATMMLESAVMKRGEAGSWQQQRICGQFREFAWMDGVGGRWSHALLRLYAFWQVEFQECVNDSYDVQSSSHYIPNSYDVRLPSHYIPNSYDVWSPSHYIPNSYGVQSSSHYMPYSHHYIQHIKCRVWNWMQYFMLCLCSVWKHIVYWHSEHSYL